MHFFAKIRWRFIGITMLLLTIVLLIVLVIFNYESYNRQYSEINGAMSYTIDTDSGDLSGDLFIPNIGDLNSSSGQRYEGSTIVYSVDVSASGVISSNSTMVYMDEDVLLDSVRYVLSNDKDKGEITEYNLFYMVKDNGFDGYRIVFADSSYFYESVSARLLFSIVGGIVILGVLFVISIFLARLAMRPVERAFAAQQRFIADASHELKTPLTVILADSEILKAHPQKTAEQQMRWIDGIRDEGTKMQGLISDLLTLAKGDTQEIIGDSNQIKENIDFSEMVERDLLQFEAIAFEGGVEIEESIDSDLRIKGDPDKIDRVVNILLDNAFKYVQAPPLQNHNALPKKVKVELKKERSNILFKVTNGGRTIPQEDLPHVFERFYRADKSRDSAISGFGLGLSIAYGIVEANGGTIGVTSDDEVGTCFSVRFPSA